MSSINKTNPNKSSAVTFYVFHLPILLLIVGIFAISALGSSKIASKIFNNSSTEQPFGYVLGDDSEDEEESEEDDQDDDEDDERDDESKDSEEGDDEDEDENENETEDDEDEDEFEQEDNDVDESYGENKSKTQERVQNSDGTYSIIKTETEGDKVKLESKTYDASGNLIREEKHEGSDEGFESETEDSSGNKLKIRVQDTQMLIKREGVTGLNNFPLYIDESDGSVYVQTSKGEVKLGIMPQSIVEKAGSLEDVDSIEEVEIESESDDRLEFKLKTKNAEKLFGVFELEIPTTVYFDAQNGEQTRSEQTFINKIIDFLSF